VHRVAHSDFVSSALDPRLRSRKIAALAIVAFAYPILVTLIFFPTPSSDLREHIDWGLHFPLYTWKHPPLQSWLAGLIALSGARDAWTYTLSAQMLNVVGVVYLVRTAQVFVGGTAAPAIVIAVCGCIYFVGAVVSFVINADQILTHTTFQTISLPLSHPISPRQYRYIYSFVAPLNCAAPGTVK